MSGADEVAKVAAGQPFTCIICEQYDEQRWAWRPQDIGIPPICKRCEHSWSTYSSWNGSSRDQGKVNAGAFGDRRMARRLFAIAEVLHVTATRMGMERENAA